MIDKEIFLRSLVLISEALTVKNGLLYDLDHLYQQDKFRYYKTASNGVCYKDSHIIDGTMQREINIRKVYGVVLCAEEDEKLRAKILKLLIKHYPEFYDPIKRRSEDLLKVIRKKPDVGPDWIVKNSYLRIPYYLARLIYGFEYDFNPFYSSLIREIEKGNLASINFVPVFNEDKYKDQPEKNEWIRVKEKEFGFFKRCKDFSAFMDYKDVMGSQPPHYSEIPSEIQSPILKSIRFAASLFDLHLLSNSALTNSIILTKKEIDNVFLTMIGIYSNDDEYKRLPNEMVALYYVFGVYFQSMIKEYVSTREIFRANNQETQFLEIEKLQEEVELGKRELKEANQKNDQLKTWISEYEKKSAAAKTDLEKSFYYEIKTLRNTNEKQKSIIDEQRLQIEELHRLREFVFALEYSDLPAEALADETFEMPANKRIFLVGGHENWKKKIKERYPTISIVDGTNKNLDTSIFSRADLVLFFTPHMNHAIYEKTIDYLNKNSIKFDYVSEINPDRFQNQLRRIFLAKNLS